jgi:hypothetical protein
VLIALCAPLRLRIGGNARPCCGGGVAPWRGADPPRVLCSCPAPPVAQKEEGREPCGARPPENAHFRQILGSRLRAAREQKAEAGAAARRAAGAQGHGERHGLLGRRPVPRAVRQDHHDGAI